MTKLELAKKILDEHFACARFGLFSTECDIDDPREMVYNDNGITVYTCELYTYVEVIGLSSEDFDELKRWYNLELEKRTPKAFV